jgi:hypothetical protein
MPEAPTIPCQRIQGTIGKLSEGVQGSFDGTWTYCNGMFGPFVKTYSPPTIEPGHFSTYDSNVVATATTLWRNLTAAQKATWQRPAYRKHMPPYTYFISVQLRQFLAGLPFLSTPNSYVSARVIDAYPSEPLSPDCSGVYIYHSTIDGYHVYRREDSAFFIIHPTGSWSYYISDTPDDPTSGHFWENLSHDPTGVYYPTSTTEGWPEVSIP